MDKITSDEKKIELVEKLLEEKRVTFREAISLLQVEVEPIYYNYPVWQPPNIFYEAGTCNTESSFTECN